MSSEWPPFPASATPSALDVLSDHGTGSWGWLARRAAVMVQAPLLPGLRYLQYSREVVTYKHAPDPGALIVEPACTFDKLHECYRGSMSNMYTAAMLNTIANRVGRVLFIGKVTDANCVVNARVTQVSYHDLAQLAEGRLMEALTQPFAFVVVAGSAVVNPGVVVDLVNAIGAPVLWYGSRHFVDAVTLVK